MAPGSPAHLLRCDEEGTGLSGVCALELAAPLPPGSLQGAEVPSEVVRDRVWVAYIQMALNRSVVNSAQEAGAALPPFCEWED